MSLLDHCTTDNEVRIISVYEKMPLSSSRTIAKTMGDMFHHSTIARTITRVKKRASLQGYSPEHNMVHTVPSTHVVKGTSTLYGEGGEVKQQWVKSNLKLDAQVEAFKEIVEAMKESITPLRPVPNRDEVYEEDLVTMITFADHHIGMLAWGEEGESDWGTEKAEKILLDCFSFMMDSSPNSETCIINNLGDFLHFDGWMPVTPTHGNVLDADARFPQVVKAAVRVLRQLVTMALEKHKHVHLVITEGNHDMSSSVWLREMFNVLYEQEPRMTVDTSPKPYQVYQFGKVMLGFHHGHIKKSDSLPLLFASEYNKEWGVTDFRYGHVGHRHHQELKEHNGMIIEQHTTLASTDAHSSRGGYCTSRKASCIVYHKEYGEVARSYVTPQMLGYN